MIGVDDLAGDAADTKDTGKSSLFVWQDYWRGAVMDSPIMLSAMGSFYDPYTATLKWSCREILHFLDLYQKHPCLWDANDPLYKLRDARVEAEKEIMQAMGLEHCNLKLFRSKVRSIRNTYNQEVNKIKRSIERSGNNEGDGKVYKPRLPWFNVADQFLWKTVQNRDTNQQFVSWPTSACILGVADASLVTDPIIGDSYTVESEGEIEAELGAPSGSGRITIKEEIIDCTSDASETSASDEINKQSEQKDSCAEEETPRQSPLGGAVNRTNDKERSKSNSNKRQLETPENEEQLEQAVDAMHRNILGLSSNLHMSKFNIQRKSTTKNGSSHLESEPSESRVHFSCVSESQVVDNTNASLKKTVNTLSSVLNRETDDCAIFGLFVASELRSLQNEHIRRKLKRRIQRDIIEAQDEDDATTISEKSCVNYKRTITIP